MIGMVLVTHGQLATGFRAALEHVVGPQSQLETITIGPEDDMEQRRSDILNAAARVQDGSGVVILTDMFGGTPSNLAISVMDGGRIEVICGVNLPDADQARDDARDGRSRSRGAWRRAKPGANTSPSPARCSRGNERAVTPRTDGAAAAGVHGGVVARLADREPEGPARARHRQIRPVRRPVRRRHQGVTRCGETVGGDSIMGILTLGAGLGSTITVFAAGAAGERGAGRACRHSSPIGSARTSEDRAPTSGSLRPDRSA